MPQERSYRPSVQGYRFHNGQMLHVDMDIGEPIVGFKQAAQAAIKLARETPRNGVECAAIHWKSSRVCGVT